MNPNIPQRLDALRDVMRQEGLAAFIFPSTDPHNGEYVPDHWKGREWISGFDGSAGTAVVTLDEAALWTDSRYFLAAERQLRGTGFRLMKEKIAGTPTIADWLGDVLSRLPSPEVGIDGTTCSASMAESLKDQLRRNGGITLRTNFDPLDRIWTGRPAIPLNPVVIHPLEYAGEAARDKLARIRLALHRMKADGMLVAALDDIAWTLNLRGSDVHCNPVFVSYLLISSSDATLFVDDRKLTDGVKAYLKAEGVKTAPYEAVTKGLEDYFEYNILLDPDEINDTIMQAARGQNPAVTPRGMKEIILQKSPIPSMKTVKNETEIRGFHQAMLRDGIAMVKFLKGLLPAVEQGRMTEITVDEELTRQRAAQPLYLENSFDTIAAYQEHGAVVHYEATPATDVTLRPEGFLLIDSGAQYRDGTTDITRTIALGPLTEQQKRVYTLVLKAHIQLEMLKFPDGASGTQLDAVARKDLWAAGLNFLHGTGHGVGSCLNVHEGPHQIRMEYKPAPLHAGMTVTDEPGIYLADRFGVRIENTLLIVPDRETEFGQFLGFESLTLCPIDTTPVLPELLLPDEINWLNEYHQRVYDLLSPHLSADESAWLSTACAAI